MSGEINGQLMLAEVAETERQHAEGQYAAFVEKFKPKLTTDDCYTPEGVYQAVADWVAAEYHLDPASFVRPFWPGADYRKMEYPAGCVVVDNPPFSLFSEIQKFYQASGVHFFLFGPSLTLYSGGVPGVCYISADADLTYANGANVKTGFVTNLDKCRIRSAPGLYQAIKAANDANLKEKKRTVPKYAYPDEVCTSAMVQRYSRYGVDFRVMPEDCTFIRALDAQRESGKETFGGSFLLSERAAAERAVADRAVVERAAAERAAVTRWTISERERSIVSRLGHAGDPSESNRP